MRENIQNSDNENLNVDAGELTPEAMPEVSPKILPAEIKTLEKDGKRALESARTALKEKIHPTKPQTEKEASPPQAQEESSFLKFLKDENGTDIDNWMKTNKATGKILWDGLRFTGRTANKTRKAAGWTGFYAFAGIGYMLWQTSKYTWKALKTCHECYKQKRWPGFWDMYNVFKDNAEKK